MNWFTRFLCRMGLHFYHVEDTVAGLVSKCNWCHSYEKGYEPWKGDNPK